MTTTIEQMLTDQEMDDFRVRVATSTDGELEFARTEIRTLADMAEHDGDAHRLQDALMMLGIVCMAMKRRGTYRGNQQ